MWVRIQEISFPIGDAESVVDAVRDGAADRHEGDGYMGFRLLMDAKNGCALDVSYWQSEEQARACSAGTQMPPASPRLYDVVRTDHYALSIDAG